MQKSTPDKFRWMKWQEAGWLTVATEGPPASARSFTLSAAFCLEMVCADGTGTRPDYLANRVDQKIEGHLRKNGTKIENSRRLCGGGVGT